MRALATLVLLIGFMSCFCCLVMGLPNFAITNQICNFEHYTLGSPFAQSLTYVFEDMERMTPTQAGYNYYSISPFSNNAIVYGHATCNTALSYDYCKACLDSAKVYLGKTCFGSIGGQLSYVDCFMRYESYSFSR